MRNCSDSLGNLLVILLKPRYFHRDFKDAPDAIGKTSCAAPTDSTLGH
jgi:hypothetical protein